MMTQTQNKSKTFGLRMAVCLVLCLSVVGTAQSQDYFPIGAWCFYAGGPSPYDPVTGLLTQPEKDKLTDLGLTYIIACVSPEAGQALINFGDEQNGNFKTTIEYTPLDHPVGKFRPWEWSADPSIFGHGSLGDPLWADSVDMGYGAMGEIYSGSPGLHSALVGAEYGISDPSRWDELQYMGNSVNSNVSGTPVSVVQNGWSSNISQFVPGVDNNDIFMIQTYPFGHGTPTEGTPFQDAVDLMARNWGDVIRSIRDNSLNMELYAVLQTSKSGTVFKKRLPSKEEVLLSMNMALAYGAKGIVHYLYAYVSYDSQEGLLDANRNPTALYYEVQDLHNTHLIPHGPEFLPLTWEEGFSIHQNTQEPISSSASLYDVRSKPPGGSYDSESNTYVEVGWFTKDPYYDYYMVVNRRADSNGTRTVKVRFQGTPNIEYKVKNMFTGAETFYTKTQVGSNGWFNYYVTLGLGEGVLLLLDEDRPAAPTNLSWSNSGGHPRLSWSANTENDLAGYRIYRNVHGCGPNCMWYDLIATVGSGTTNYTDTQITISRFGPNYAYYYVTAIDESDLESEESDTVSVPTNQANKIATNWDEENEVALPNKYELLKNRPNPFNPITTIQYNLPEDSFIRLKIYDLTGREMRSLVNGKVEAGFKSVVWDSRDNRGNPVSSGVYIIHFRARSQETGEAFHETGKMVLLR